jgi:hypothetical protein
MNDDCYLGRRGAERERATHELTILFPDKPENCCDEEEEHQRVWRLSYRAAEHWHQIIVEGFPKGRKQQLIRGSDLYFDS